MSILFPKVPKPREWDYRPIYYDPKKEAREERRNQLHRGSFREVHEKNMSTHKAARQSKLVFYIALLILLLFFGWCLI